MKIWPSVWNTCKESLIMSPNIHEHPWTSKTHLRKSEKYRAAGSQTWIRSTWGGCTCLVIPQLARKTIGIHIWIHKAVFLYTTVSKCTTVQFYTQRWAMCNESQRTSTKTDENRQGIHNETNTEIPTEIQGNLKIARLVCLPSSNLFLGFKGSGERNCTSYNLLGDR